MMVVLVVVYSMVTTALVGFFDRLCDAFSGAFFFAMMRVFDIFAARILESLTGGLLLLLFRWKASVSLWRRFTYYCRFSMMVV